MGDAYLAQADKLLRREDLGGDRNVAPGHLCTVWHKPEGQARPQPAGHAGALLRLQVPQIRVLLCRQWQLMISITVAICFIELTSLHSSVERP